VSARRSAEKDAWKPVDEPDQVRIDLCHRLDEDTFTELIDRSEEVAVAPFTQEVGRLVVGEERVGGEEPVVSSLRLQRLR